MVFHACNILLHSLMTLMVYRWCPEPCILHYTVVMWFDAGLAGS